MLGSCASLRTSNPAARAASVVTGPIVTAGGGVSSSGTSIARFVTVDADTNPALVARYGVVSLPTLQFMAGGELVDVLYGARPKAVLNEQVQKLLAAV